MVGVKKSRPNRFLLGLLLTGLLLFFSSHGTVQAQDYSFSVDSNLAWVYIQEDGSIDIIYDITFTCDAGAHPIDVVDIGLPNEHYDLSSAQATVDSHPLSDIRESEWLDTGVEVHLGSHQIEPGQTGTLRLWISNPRMVFQDREDTKYASVRFSPTWFGSEFTHGTTHLRVTIYFPPGVQPDETRYHDQRFTETRMEGLRPVMTWVVEQARPDEQYQFGVSFPKRYVQRVFAQPGKPVPEATPRPIAAQTKKSTSGSSSDLAEFAVEGTCCLASILFSLAGGGTAAVKRRRKRMEYMPPLVSVEGMAVKRGLTAVEASVLLEAPLNRVLTMLLFGLVRKEAVRVVSEKPLRLEKAEPLPDGLHPYENDFLAAIKANGELGEKQLTTTMTGLIKEVNQKMKGFHAKDTISYYKDIVARAWKQVEAGDTPEVVDENLEWMMADENFEEKMPEVFGERPIPMPIWWWAYTGPPRPAAAARPSPGKAAPVPTGPRTVPGAQLANAVVSRVEGVSNSMVRNVSAFTAGVTKVTHPAAVSTSPGWTGRGISCACACACAGCACACAGGGR